jgi:hypothetical protein
VAAVALSIDRIGSPANAALLVTAFAVGSLVGAVVETAHPTRARPHVVMGLGFLATGVFTVLAAADLGTAWTVVAIGISGAFTASGADRRWRASASSGSSRRPSWRHTRRAGR